MANKVQNLIILGPQGSGKGTQAKLLESGFGYIMLGAGDLLREIEKTDTPLGREIHQTITVEGKLVRPEIITEVFRTKLQSLSVEKSVIMESYPRNLEQYGFMKKFWPGLGRGNYQVIFVDLPEEEAVKRISSRRICENCGAIYIAGQEPEKCARCGGKIIGRADDYPEAVRMRLRIFQKETMPLIVQLEKEGRLIRVDGAPSVNEVHKEIIKKLELGSTSPPPASPNPSSGRRGILEARGGGKGGM